MKSEEELGISNSKELDILALKKLKIAFRIKTLKIKHEAFPSPGICKYKFNDQREIVSVFFKDYTLNIPNSITSLENLVKLSIKFTPKDYYMRAIDPPRLHVLPKNFGMLHNLFHLDFTGSSLRFLPENFGNLTNLQTATFVDNTLGSLPESFRHLQSLITLDLSNNLIYTLPKFISELKNLKNLNIKGNFIGIFPEFLGKLNSLLTLDLRSCGLTLLPNYIGNLKNLRTFYADKNDLRLISEAIGDLTNLRVLNLDGNKHLQNLPQSINKLHNLQKLFLGGTEISLPKSISELSNLNTIGLSMNQLKSFAKFGTELQNLKKILIYTDHFRRWGYDYWSHDYNFIILDNYSMFEEPVKKCFEELQKNGCRILISSLSFD